MSNENLAQVFEGDCDPQIYIPRRAGEEVLRAASRLLRDGEPVVVLHGPAGIGKTMLLRVLGERFEFERRVAYVSVREAPEPELSHRVLDLLDEPSAEDPAEALICAANDAEAGRPRLLLLIDHANLAPIASSLQLVSAAFIAAPNLSVIFAVADEQGARDFARALAAEVRVTTLCFDQPMDPPEATAYVRLRLARSQIPAALRAQLDARTMQWLSEGAQAGLPREINRRASELLRTFEEYGAEALQFSDATPTSSRVSAPVDQPEVATPSAESSAEPDTVQAAVLPETREEIRPQGVVRAESSAPPVGHASPNGQAGLGSGSLGGMLLGNRSENRLDFKLDLELGRSLGSSLLATSPSTAAPPHPAPTPGPRAIEDSIPDRPAETLPRSGGSKEIGHPVPADPVVPAPTDRLNRGGLPGIAALIVLLIAGSYLVTRETCAEPTRGL
jgi:hypothetical protein